MERKLLELPYIGFWKLADFNVVGEFRLDPGRFNALVVLLDSVFLRWWTKVDCRRFTLFTEHNDKVESLNGN